jgi:hypothetical protein
VLFVFSTSTLAQVLPEKYLDSNSLHYELKVKDVTSYWSKDSDFSNKRWASRTEYDSLGRITAFYDYHNKKNDSLKYRRFYPSYNICVEVGPSWYYPEASIHTKYFDAKGNIIRGVVVDSCLNAEFSFHYKNSKLVKKEMKDHSCELDSVADYSVFYEYDDSGRLIKSWSDFFEETYYYKYNESGDLIEEIGTKNDSTWIVYRYLFEYKNRQLVSRKSCLNPKCSAMRISRYSYYDNGLLYMIVNQNEVNSQKEYFIKEYTFFE